MKLAGYVGEGGEDLGTPCALHVKQVEFEFANGSLIPPGFTEVAVAKLPLLPAPDGAAFAVISGYFPTENLLHITYSQPAGKPEVKLEELALDQIAIGTFLVRLPR